MDRCRFLRLSLESIEAGGAHPAHSIKSGPSMSNPKPATRSLALSQLSHAPPHVFSLALCLRAVSPSAPSSLAAGHQASATVHLQFGSAQAHVPVICAHIACHPSPLRRGLSRDAFRPSNPTVPHIVSESVSMTMNPDRGTRHRFRFLATMV